MRFNYIPVIDRVAAGARLLPSVLWGRYYQARFMDQEPEAQTYGTGLPTVVLKNVLSATVYTSPSKMERVEQRL